MEPLQHLFQRDNKLLGFRDSQGEVYKASIFADDTVVYMAHINSRIAKQNYSLLTEASGVALNVDKTKIYLRFLDLIALIAEALKRKFGVTAL